MASEKILNQKKEEVKKLADEMKQAKLILLTNYRGINVTDDTSLRRDLRGTGANYTIIKNNITRRALAECGIEGLEEKLEGPTAVIISNEDYLEPSKVIYKFSKDNEYYTIKGGVVEGKVMSADEIITLAKLPSRETLLSMLAGALLGNISKIAVALDQVRLQKEEAGEKVEAPVKEETATEEATKEPAEEKKAEEVEEKAVEATTETVEEKVAEAEEPVAEAETEAKAEVEEEKPAEAENAEEA